ncbi:Protein IFH1 [Nakaseomyces bracarensis]|uniref:Protein IFH1 n=1 Tax=Nakaseomyces bracarensis TaxID=273131 RepID=A0ABR4NTN1_9SACH
MSFQRSSKSPRKGVVSGKGPAPSLNSGRPRRFSLIYSSDSSLSDISEKQASDISEGEEDEQDEEDDDDDDDDEDDTSSSSDDDDENIDFVKLSAQRKKRAMQALSAYKNQHLKADSTPIEEEDVGEEVVESEDSEDGDDVNNKDNTYDNTVGIDNDIPVPQFKESDDDEDNGKSAADSSDEEEEDDAISIDDGDFNDDDNEGQSDAESDYDIDQDAYFDAIEKEDESDMGIETGNEEDLPTILHEEEQNIMNEFDQTNNDISNWDAESSLSSFDMFDGFGNEEEEEEEEDSFKEQENSATKRQTTDDFSTDLQNIELSVDKPVTLGNKDLEHNRKKDSISKIRKPERKSAKKKHNRSLKDTLDSEDYIFNVFFQSDDSADDKDDTMNKESDTESLQLSKFFSGKTVKVDETDDTSKNILLDVAHLPSDDEILSSDKQISDSDLTGSDEEDNFSDLDGISISSVDLDEDEEDDLRLSNVFVDIDDLDPDAFYFHYDDENDSSGSLDIDDVNLYLNKDDDSKQDVVETVLYVDDESTDEDDNLPPPEARTKTIGTKAKEVVSANVVGLKPPKLGTWNTNNKPFSIIDGLSTKSLHALIQEHQQLKDQKANGTDYIKQETPSSVSPNGDELTLNELLNMSELEDEDGMTSSNAISNNNSTDRNGNIHNLKSNAYNSLSITDWYEKPKVPLSAFRNKGINVFQEDEFMAPITQIKKVPLGYMGMEKTRRKFDKMKEIQKKRTEKKRKLKKKKKMLKMKREQARLIKENEIEEQLLPPPIHIPTDHDFQLPTIE